MLVYRITSSTYASDISGTGAAMFGGRWNKKGMPVLYTGESKEIALLETIVNTPPMLIPQLDILTLKIPNSYTEFTLDSLPENWSDYPAPTILSELASEWAKECKTIALKVPSCVIHSSSNYILNCRHPQFHKKVRIIDQQAFHFDTRLSR
jgi:RES domain-containing protein